jgi:predicted  nucleic acid-binding Zn-ribbon protein
MTDHLRELIKLQAEHHILQMQALAKIFAKLTEMSNVLQTDTAAVTAIVTEIGTIASTVADLSTQQTAIEALLTAAQNGGTQVDQAALASAIAQGKTALDALATSVSTLDAAAQVVANPPQTPPASPTPATS